MMIIGIILIVYYSKMMDKDVINVSKDIINLMKFVVNKDIFMI